MRNPVVEGSIIIRKYTMSLEQKTSEPRSSRRNDRRPERRSDSRSNGSGASRSEYRPTSGASSRRTPEKKTFWQKILSFFNGGKAENNHESQGRSSNRSYERSNDRSSERPNDRSKERSAPRERSTTERPPRPAIRKPEEVEVTTPRVYVGNLSFDAVETDLTELFNGVGIVQSVDIVSNKHTQRSKGFAFVQMQTVEEAKRAVAELHDKEYMGRKLVVSGAKAAEERRSERSQPQAEQ